jgi:hypothetical protein
MCADASQVDVKSIRRSGELRDALCMLLSNMVVDLTGFGWAQLWFGGRFCGFGLCLFSRKGQSGKHRDKYPGKPNL